MIGLPLTPFDRLESMQKTGGREGRAKVAVAARRLMSLAKEVDGVKGAEEVSLIPPLYLKYATDTLRQTRDTIEKFCERFEKEMLKSFDRYYRKGDPKAMAVSGTCSSSESY